jgi:Tol biopolymer transport system component
MARGVLRHRGRRRRADLAGDRPRVDPEAHGRARTLLHLGGLRVADTAGRARLRARDGGAHRQQADRRGYEDPTSKSGWNLFRASAVPSGMRREYVTALTAVVAFASVTGCFDGEDSAREPTKRRPSESGRGGSAGIPAELEGWQLAFMHRPDGGAQADLHVANVDGSDLVRLDELRGDEQTPNWSPDGRKVAIRWVPRDYDNTPLLILDAQTSRVLNLTRRTGLRGFSPSWSPDGSRLVTAAKRRPNEQLSLYVMRADGSNVRRITPGDREAQYATWSPDGSRIAFTYVVDGGFDLFTIRPDGTALRRLTSEGAGGQNNWPMWSPDGTRIAWGRRDEIWVMNADGSDKRFLTREGGVPAAWAPGPWIAFGCLVEDDAVSLCAIDPNGRNLVPLLGGLDAGFPGWRPRSRD